MLNKLKFHHGKRYQPHPRVGHTTVVIGDRMYLWGGWHKHIPKLHSNAEKIKALSVIDVYNLRTGDWGEIPTSGLPPLGMAYHACVNLGEDLYYFGGRCGHGGCHHNTMHRLSTVTMKWKDVTPPFDQADEGPMKKAQCGMIAFKWRNEEMLFIAGGYGLLPVHRQSEAKYVPKRGKPEYGWTNEGNIFAVKSGSWLIPHVTGEAPPPCSNFSLTSISDSRGIMFGGYQPETNRLSDMFVVELGKETVFWSKLARPGDINGLWPKSSCDHSMIYVASLHSDRPHPCLIVIGGEDDDGKILNDCWILELQTVTWKHILLPVSVASRLYHSVSAFTLGPHCIWLVLFGGVSDIVDDKDWQEQSMLSNTAVIELVKRGEQDWVSAIITNSSNPLPNAVEDYVRKLNDRVFQGRKDWVSITTKLPSFLPVDEEKSRAERAEHRADVAEQQVSEFRKLVEESQLIVTQVKNDAVKERKESSSLYGDLSDARKRALKAETDYRKANEEALKAKNEAKRLEGELAEAERKLEELQEEMREEMMKIRNELHSLQSTSTSSTALSLESPEWVLKNEDLQICDKVLIRSRSGEVHLGTFRGAKVAVKYPHKVTSLEEFTKAMNIISNLHHPNLLLFIGALLGENPVIVTEVPPSKPLNILLEESPLSRGSILSISRDIACALNHLHLHNPHPIIHGSISSHVVFAETTEGIRKAKLSDTALFPHFIQPPAAYAAPEIPNPSAHTHKMDVYSFGVLLIEMYCRKALGSSLSTERDKQLQHINWPEMVYIIRQCLVIEPNDRQHISNILIELNDLSC